MNPNQIQQSTTTEPTQHNRFIGTLLALGVIITIAAIAFAVIWVYPSTPESLRRIAKEQGVDYNDLCARAESNDVDAMSQLIDFSAHTDGESALNHSVILVSVISRLGEDKAVEMVPLLTFDQKRTLKQLVETGTAYTMGKDGHYLDPKTTFPKLWNALPDWDDNPTNE